MMAIWCILWSFGIIIHVLVFCAKKNLATLVPIDPKLVGLTVAGSKPTHGYVRMLGHDEGKLYVKSPWRPV
jgi:hypothetical protein